MKANGSYTTAHEVQAYDFAMAYDAIHNITHKYQQHTVTRGGGSPRIERATSYDWAYSYRDFNQPQPHAPTHIGNRTFSYDANGNQTGWENTDNGTRRVIVWDEENRIREVQDPKHAARFTYDDTGERKLKWSQYGETAYVNQFFTVRNGAIASTHVYAGNTRIVTKVNAGRPVGKVTRGNLNGTGNLSTTTATGGSFIAGGTSTTASSSTANSSAATSGFPGQGLAHRSERANEVAQNTLKNPHYTGVVPGQGGNVGGGHGGGNGGGNAGGHSGNGKGGVGGGNGSGNGSGGGMSGGGSGREFLYFYHPDHLGSSNYVTDEHAKRYEHLAYFPFGETWVQEATATWRVPYQYTSKEMDPETGLYYFGARYYDPRTSVWQSADPILSNYLNGAPSGGVYNSTNIALYTYVGGNPIKRIDPDGRAWWNSGGKPTWIPDFLAPVFKFFGADVRKTMATATANSLTIYGEHGRNDITQKTANHFRVVQFPESGPGIDRTGPRDTYAHPVTGRMGQWGDNWMDPQAAAALYNAVQEYLGANPAHANDVPLKYNDIAAYDPTINLGHSTHGSAKAVDFLYMDRNGQPTTSIYSADLARQNEFTGTRRSEDTTMKWTSFIALLPLGVAQVALCADLSISSLKITYKDNVSVPGKVIVRELKSFQEDTFWSKPTKVDITVRVRNASKDETAIAVVVRPEMYVLLDRMPGTRFPALSMERSAPESSLRGVTELKSKMTGPVWVWNRAGRGVPIELKPGQETKVELKDVDIANAFTPSDYVLLGIAIRVFVDSRGSKDPDYSNNVVDAIIMYGA